MGKVKCEYCGTYIDTSEEKCPSCGAVNAGFQRTVSDTPRTIEELKAWYSARKLPPENITRFFIGKNVSEARAFGIYKENSGIVTVYKNKANGSRAIRYRGTDEAYAVNELYLKLKDEILNQKRLNLRKKNNTKADKRSQKPLPKRAGQTEKQKEKTKPTKEDVRLTVIICICLALFMIFGRFIMTLLLIALLTIALPEVIAFFLCEKLNENRPANRQLTNKAAKPILIIGSVLAIVIFFSFGFRKTDPGSYFVTDNSVYFRQEQDWFRYDPGNESWSPSPSADVSSGSYCSTTPPSVSRSFYETEYYDSGINGYVWEASYWYENINDNFGFDDNDSGYDWDSGSDWDSGGTDWDSDW